MLLGLQLFLFEIRVQIKNLCKIWSPKVYKHNVIYLYSKHLRI